MGAIPQLLGLVALMTLSLDWPRAAGANPRSWSADATRSEILVHVFKKGLFSGAAHDHHFAVGSFRVTVTLDEADPSQGRFEVVISADSLRDRQPALSDGDRAKVEAQAAGEEVLDAPRYPQIRFAPGAKPAARLSWAEDGSVDGELEGTLSLHGQERPITVPVHATREGDRWRAQGSVRLKQSDFGIRPYSGFLGVVAVQDEIRVDFDLILDLVR